jgi:hypothetical protein
MRLKFLIILLVLRKNNRFKRHLPNKLGISIRNMTNVIDIMMMGREEESKITIKGIGIDKIMHKKEVKDTFNRHINKNHKIEEIEAEIVYKNSQDTIVNDKQSITNPQTLKITNAAHVSVPVPAKNNPNPDQPQNHPSRPQAKTRPTTSIPPTTNTPTTNPPITTTIPPPSSRTALSSINK